MLTTTFNPYSMNKLLLFAFLYHGLLWGQQSNPDHENELNTKQAAFNPADSLIVTEKLLLEKWEECVVLGKNLPDGEGYGYRWEVVDGATGEIISYDRETEVCPTSTTQYKVVVTDGANILEERIFVLINCNMRVEPEYPFILNDEEGVEVEVIPNAPGYIYKWSHDSLLNKPIAKFNRPGAYSVTVTDLDGCVSSETFEVAKLSSVDVTICKGACIDIGVASKPRFSYLWDANKLSDNTNSIQTICPKESRSYTLNIINEDGFEEETIMYMVRVSHSEIEITPQPAFLCEGSSVRLNIVAENAQNIRWSNGDVGSSTVVTVAGIFTATVTTSDCIITEAVEVIDKSDCEKVAAWFTSNGFRSEEVDGYRTIGIINGNQNFQKDSGIEINDFANITLIVNDIEADLEEYALTSYQSFVDNVKIYITSSDNICEGSDINESVFNDVSEVWNSARDVYIVWMHVCMRDDGTAIFFTNEKFVHAEEIFEDDRRK